MWKIWSTLDICTTGNFQTSEGPVYADGHKPKQRKKENCIGDKDEEEAEEEGKGGRGGNRKIKKKKYLKMITLALTAIALFISACMLKLSTWNDLGP